MGRPNTQRSRVINFLIQQGEINSKVWWGPAQVAAHTDMPVDRARQMLYQESQRGELEGLKKQSQGGKVKYRYVPPATSEQMHTQEPLVAGAHNSVQIEEPFVFNVAESAEKVRSAAYDMPPTKWEEPETELDLGKYEFVGRDKDFCKVFAKDGQLYRIMIVQL